jgi:hypothetical protein
MAPDAAALGVVPVAPDVVAVADPPLEVPPLAGADAPADPLHVITSAPDEEMLTLSDPRQPSLGVALTYLWYSNPMAAAWWPARSVALPRLKKA